MPGEFTDTDMGFSDPIVHRKVYEFLNWLNLLRGLRRRLIPGAERRFPRPPAHDVTARARGEEHLGDTDYYLRHEALSTFEAFIATVPDARPQRHRLRNQTVETW